jgi:hypothetical protein
MLGAFPSCLWRSLAGPKIRLHALSARWRVPLEAEYGFLLGRFIDSATLARANAIALRWGVHPHQVMIANGWLDAEDYYRALAQNCGATFRAKLPASEIATAAAASPRQSPCERPAQEARAGEELRLCAGAAPAQRASRDAGAAFAL